MSKFCSGCGKPLAEGAQFCANCGKPCAKPQQPVEQAVQPPVQAPVQQPVQAPEQPPVQQPAERPQYNYATPNNAGQQPVQQQPIRQQSAPAQPAPSQPVQAQPAPVQPYPAASAPAQNAAGSFLKNKKNVIIIASVAAALVIAGVILLIVLVGGGGKGASSPSDIVSKCEKLLNNDSPSKDDYADLYFRYNYLKNSTQKEKLLNDLDPKPFINDDVKEKYGDDAAYTLKMIGEETYTTGNFSSAISSLSDQYDTSNIEEIKTVKIEYKLSGSKNSDTYTASVLIYKVSGRWYLASSPLGN